jgi:hypothetical protein
MPSEARPNQFGNVYLTPEQDVNDCKVQINTHIGRRLLPSAAKPEPIYLLRWRDPERRTGRQGNVNETLTVRFQRVAPLKPGQGETLALEQVLSGTFNNQPVAPQEIELKLCTIQQGKYWMDTGRFEINWPS